MPRWIVLCSVVLMLGSSTLEAAESPLDLSWADWSHVVLDPQALIPAVARKQIQETALSSNAELRVPLYVVMLPSLAEYGAQGMQPDSFAAVLLDAMQQQLTGENLAKKDRALLLLMIEEDRAFYLALGSTWDGDFFARSRRMVKEAQASITPEFPATSALSQVSAKLVTMIRKSQGKSSPLAGREMLLAGTASALLLLAFLLFLWHRRARKKIDGLTEAVQDRSRTLIQQKLKCGANPDAYDDQGYTAAIYAAGQGDLQTLQMLHQYDADLGLATEQGETPLYSAAQNGHASVAAFLLAKGVPVDPLTVHNETPLLIAAREGHLEIVAGLLYAGANVNQQDNRGWSALMIALREAHADVVNLLVNHNVDVNLAPKDGAHALMMAVKQEDETLVRRLIAQGADVHHHARDGMCALRIAVLRGNQPIARRLLNAGANVSAPFSNKEKPAEMAERQGHAELAAYLTKREKRLAACMDILEVVARGDLNRIKEIVVQVPQSVNVHSKKSRWTPLLIAVRAEQIEIAETLLDHGADVHARSNEGKSAIAYAVDAGNLALVKVLLEGGARIDQIDATGTDLRSYAEALHLADVVAFADSFVDQQAAGYALFKAVKEDDPPRALTILKEHPGCVDARTRHERWTPLLQAAREGNLGMAKLLIEYNAQVNLCNSRGMSPLMYAARSGNLDLIRLLLERGADVRICSREGNTACEFALDKGHARAVMLLQEIEAQRSDLSSAGFPGEGERNPEEENTSRALDIFQAVQEYDIERVKQVLHYWPASTRLRWGPSELTALHMAISAGMEAIVQLLLEAGADVNTPTREGRTPLHMAVGRADASIVALLVDRGADVEAISQGQTVLRAAEAAGYQDIVELLERTRHDNRP